MKLFKFLPALLIALALVVAGCGESEEKKQLDQVTATQTAAVQSASREVGAISNQLSKISNDSKGLADAARNLEFEMKKNQMMMEELTNRLNELKAGLDSNHQMLAEQAARKPETSGIARIFGVLFVIILVIVLLGLIYFMVRGRSDYNEEDDDLSDFEDDDLGFEDDFEEEDFLDEDEKKKAAEDKGAEGKDEDKK